MPSQKLARTARQRCKWPVMAFLWSVLCIPLQAQRTDVADAEVLPGTKPLTWQGDIASRLVDGVDRFLLRELDAAEERRGQFWQRSFESAEAYQKSIEPNRKRLAAILGLSEDRVPPRGIQYKSSTSQPSLVASSSAFDIHEVDWPVFGGIRGEGLLLIPKSKPVAGVVAVPHCDHTPEQICGLADGVALDAQYARILAEQGCVVVVPTLIDREMGQYEWPQRRVDIPHREFLYRSAFELGRHLIGYEVQKILAAIDNLENLVQDEKLGVVGFGDGGMVSLYCASLDDRIDAVCVCGYFQNRNLIWEQPLDRNVFGLLEQFGDAELAAMVSPRRLVVEACGHPAYELGTGTPAAPARLLTPAFSAVENEFQRATAILKDWPQGRTALELVGDGGGQAFQAKTRSAFLKSLSVDQKKRADAKLVMQRDLPDRKARMLRQMQQIDRHTQAVLRVSHQTRQAFMSKVSYHSVKRYQESIEPYRRYFAEEVIGEFKKTLSDPNPRMRKIRNADGVDYYEVVLDVFPDVIAYGVLCLPDDVGTSEKRPVVVCQHGLEGRPQSVIGEQDFRYYKAFATQLARRGFVTFAPQNLYIFTDRFRSLQRKAYPIKKTLFSIIVPQHQQIVNWLQALPYVDPDRVAFYGLSYGGKSAMRVPPLISDYCLSICSADFNEWVDKNASTTNPRSYVWSGEYEIFEWNLGGTFNYAEMAALIAPRPFMVERGHFDGVADDWTVGWEFAKVRNLYQARLKLKDHSEIEWFDGPHSINGQGTFRFLHKHLDWPEPESKE